MAESARLWVDVTTTWQERGRHPHGTTRVERSLVAALTGEPGAWFFRREGGSYVEVAPDAVVAAATAATLGDRGRQPQPSWWRHPIVLRARALRRWLRQLRVVAPPPLPPPPPNDPFEPGAMLLLAGEHDRHDFQRLAALKREKGLRFAFVFYDVLRVLEDGDPRLADPAAWDLPQTDFILRVADLVLPISRFSADEFRRHCARRGVTGPPVTPIRLGCEVAAGAGATVAGLVPGGFVLSVGDVVARKNHALLVSVWTALGQAAPVLVIAGRVDREGDELVARIRGDRVLRQTVRVLPDVGDAELVWLYRNCRFTLFPSRLEGFGLPVAESLGFGKVCLASTAAAIPEAGQGAAISLDPGDEAAWVGAVRTLMDDGALAQGEALVTRTFRPITWAETAREVVAALGAG